MSSAELVHRLEVARELIREAGALAMSYFEDLASLDVSHKGPQDVVSAADLAVERLIKQRLADAFAEDGFFGEESGLVAPPEGGGIWVVDPIDGTQPFLSGLRSWCVSIAYVRDDQPLLGLVYSPAQEELFVGGVGIPATLNGRPITVQRRRDLTDGLTYLGCSSRMGPEQVVPVLDRLLRAGGMFVRDGSGALGLCYVACGRLLGFVEVHINSYDCLGGIAIVNAAGGRTNDFLTGEALTRGNRIIAGPPQLYDQLAFLLEAAAPYEPAAK